MPQWFCRTLQDEQLLGNMNTIHSFMLLSKAKDHNSMAKFTLLGGYKISCLVAMLGILAAAFLSLRKKVKQVISADVKYLNYSICLSLYTENNLTTISLRSCHGQCAELKKKHVNTWKFHTKRQILHLVTRKLVLPALLLRGWQLYHQFRRYVL